MVKIYISNKFRKFFEKTSRKIKKSKNWNATYGCTLFLRKNLLHSDENKEQGLEMA